MRPAVRAAVGLLVAVAARPPRVWSQDWATSGYDAQRSSWVRAPGRIAPDSLRKPGFRLLWTLAVTADASERRAVAPPVLRDLVIGHRGFKALGFVGAGADHLVAVDTDLGQLEWERRLGAPTPGRPACRATLAPNIAIPTNAALPSFVAEAGGYGSDPARSAVGAPGEGAVTLAEPPRRRASPTLPPQPARPRPAPRPFPVVYAIASDGALYTLNTMTGADAEPPIPFLPAHARALGLIVVDDVAYVAASRGCGPAPNAVWALDLGSKHVATWHSPGEIAGPAGPAIGPDGTLYVATTTGALVALEPRTLRPPNGPRAGASGFASAPLLFADRDGLLLAAATRRGDVRLFDAHTFAPLKTQPSRVPAGATARALASWHDAGARWLVASTAGPLPASAIVAWKRVDPDGVSGLAPAWVSHDIAAPLAPLVVNGVVFAVSGHARPSASVLYALDGATGAELWNSGTAITSREPAGLTAGGSQVYVVARDGTLYAFGFPMEH